jgi:tRNA U55 pseudouridine synthase TruB
MRIKINTQVVLIQLIITASNRKAKNKRFVVFCPEKVAIRSISGIITTDLGKTATHAEVRRAQKTDTSLQNMPFFLTEERHFFWPRVFQFI